MPKLYSLQSHWKQARGVIKTRWPLFACIQPLSHHSDDSAKQWCDLDGCPELLLIGWDQLFKTRQTTLAATASTASSNVSSNCAYRTMAITVTTVLNGRRLQLPGRNCFWLAETSSYKPFLPLLQVQLLPPWVVDVLVRQLRYLENWNSDVMLYNPQY